MCIVDKVAVNHHLFYNNLIGGLEDVELRSPVNSCCIYVDLLSLRVYPFPAF